MSRNSWSQRTGPKGRPLFSPSQMGKRKCRRRWGFRYLDKLEDPAGPAATKGTAAHEEVELFQKLGKVPHTKWALRALKYCPAPGTAEVEAVVRFDRWACWLGYIDLVYGWVGEISAGYAVPLGESDTVVVHDHKFTGSLRNAKPAAELEVDPAACVYAYEAYLGGARRVIGRWVYIEMNDKADVQEVWFELRRETVERVVAELDNEAMLAESDTVKHRSGKLKVLDLSIDEGQCYAYRQQCPFFGPCHESPGTAPRSRFSLNKAKGEETVSSFKDSMDARFPDGQKAPPPSSKPAASAPPPSSKAPPPSSASKQASAPPPSSKKPILSEEELAEMRAAAAENVGKVEKGSINSPEADDVAPRNPEEAAAAQGAKKPEPPPPDDLDNLPGDEKAQRTLALELALEIGAAEEGTKMRLVGLRNAIRVHRKQHGTTCQIVDGKVLSQGDASEIASAKEYLRDCGVGSDTGVGGGSHEDATTAGGTSGTPKTYAPSEGSVSFGGVPVSGFADGQQLSIDADDFTLLINGLLVATDYDLETMDQNTIMRAVHEDLGIADYRFVDYGKGPGEVACCVRKLAEDGFFRTVDMIYVDQRTDFGRVLVDVLSELATTVLRGG